MAHSYNPRGRGRRISGFEISLAYTEFQDSQRDPVLNKTKNKQTRKEGKKRKKEKTDKDKDKDKESKHSFSGT